MMPGNVTIPVVLVWSISGIIPERRLRVTSGALAWRAVAPSASSASMRVALAVDVVGQAVERHRRGGHRVADHHPADRDEVARRGLEHAEREHQSERGRSRDRERDRDRLQRSRHRPRATAGGDEPAATIPASSSATTQRLSESKTAWIT